MAVKINVAGKAKPKPATRTRKTAATPAAKATGTKRATSARAASTTRKRSEPKPAAAASNRRSSVPQTDDRTMKRLLSDVEKAGKLRAKAEAAHKASVQALYEAATNALNSGVPMAEVSKVSGISRQWLYKMGDFAKRGNGSTAAAPKTTTRKASTAKATPAKSRTSTKRTQSKGAKASTRPRIRTAK